jgi:hypothetical protein
LHDAAAALRVQLARMIDAMLHVES